VEVVLQMTESMIVIDVGSGSPRRNMAKPLSWYEAAPYGVMMLTGCLGLLSGMGII